MDQLTLGVIGRSRKENEHRLPIHPNHFERIDAIRASASSSSPGTANSSGSRISQLSRSVAGVLDREQLIARTDVVLLPKPQPEDLAELRAGQVLWAGRTASRTTR